MLLDVRVFILVQLGCQHYFNLWFWSLTLLISITLYQRFRFLLRSTIKFRCLLRDSLLLLTFSIEISQNYLSKNLRMPTKTEKHMSITPTNIGPATLRLSAWPKLFESLGVTKLFNELPILGKLRQIPSTIFIKKELLIVRLL